MDSRGLCPTGWHVPTDCEWMYLEGSLGMTTVDQELSGWRGTYEGGKLKEVTGWDLPNTGANNSNGFSALPGGFRSVNGGLFFDLGINGLLWSSTLGTSSFPLDRKLFNSSSSILRGYSLSIQDGFSVRCLKDSETPPIFGCTDGSACNFMANANQDDGSCLYLNAACDDGNGYTVNDVINSSCQCVGIAIVNGCTNPEACNFNAAANVDNGSCLIQGTACNDNNANTTNDVINGSCVCAGTAVGNGTYVPGNGATDIDGNTYTSIIINGQEWMQQNLAVTKYRNGDPIPTGLSNTTWQNTTNGAYAIYNNDAANNTLYGKLYNWYAVNDSRGLCPIGWHVPSDAEWTTLETNLGGSSVAGGKMKATTGWNSPNTGATNESGFTGFPGGYRFYVGSYYAIGDYGFWWSSSEYASTYAWHRVLYYEYSYVSRNYTSKQVGYSVRCVRD